MVKLQAGMMMLVVFGHTCGPSPIHRTDAVLAILSGRRSLSDSYRRLVTCELSLHAMQINHVALYIPTMDHS